VRDHILHHIDQIEKQHDVKVLYACDAGSRAYGLHAPGSDYDVRFIYIHKPEWYLSIDQQRDVIELPVDDLLDMNGWDLQKALKLFRKSNPPLFEWLQSELVYISDSFFVNSIKELEAEVFSPVPVLYHHLKDVKKSQDGQMYVDHNPVLHHFIEKEVEHLEAYIQAQDTTKKEITPQLNQLFLENLQHSWGKIL